MRQGLTVPRTYFVEHTGLEPRNLPASVSAETEGIYHHRLIFLFTLCDHGTAYRRKSKDRVQDWVLSFHLMGPEDQMQVARIGGDLTNPNMN